MYPLNAVSMYPDKLNSWNQCFVIFLNLFYFLFFQIELFSFFRYTITINMVLKINIHRYTDKYKTVLSLKKKKTIKTKPNKRKILQLYLSYFHWLLRPFDFFLQWTIANVSDHSLCMEFRCKENVQKWRIRKNNFMFSLTRLC